MSFELRKGCKKFRMKATNLWPKRALFLGAGSPNGKLRTYHVRGEDQYGFCWFTARNMKELRDKILCWNATTTHLFTTNLRFKLQKSQAPKRWGD